MAERMNDMELAVAREIARASLAVVFAQERNELALARADDFNESELRWLTAFRRRVAGMPQ